MGPKQISIKFGERIAGNSFAQKTLIFNNGDGEGNKDGEGLESHVTE